MSQNQESEPLLRKVRLLALFISEFSSVVERRPYKPCVSSSILLIPITLPVVHQAESITADGRLINER